MKNTLLVIVVIVVVSIGIAVNYFQFKRAIEEVPTKSEFRQLAWQFAMDIPKPTNAILTDVGVIQFLDNGFSISLDSADWKSEGLVLTGTLGNSTNLQVSSLTLKITAQKTMYSLHKEFMESESIYPSYLFIL
ncbi:hypothetical protein IIA15_10100, partial [candidate division TA06 bacterium]|nr:hypothetical protein [candidate division TA06 bacterium]